ncbi:hypothetical protein [Streptomyces umbrinus]|uniref:hypothetical protein n=1 Tax=Streptomyces umbrinus TaxID=67370 RepID=UPI0034035969
MVGRGRTTRSTPRLFATCHGLRTPDLGTPARSVTVGLAYALAAALLLQVGSVRPYALAASAAGAGVIAAAAQAGGGAHGPSADLGSWWVALVLYGVLGLITTAFPWLYPRSGAADPPLDLGQLADGITESGR